MLKFMETFDSLEDTGVTLAQEAVIDADYFGIEYDPATESLNSVGIRIGATIRNIVDRIKKWLRRAVNKVKELFLKIAKRNYGSIDSGTYKSLMEYLKTLNAIDYSTIAGKKNSIAAMASKDKTSMTEAEFKKFSDMCEGLRNKTDELKNIDAVIKPSNSATTISLNGLQSEKIKFAKDLKEVEDFVKVLEGLSVTYEHKYKTENADGKSEKATATINVTPALSAACSSIIKIVNAKLAVITRIEAETKSAAPKKEEEK